MLSPPSPLARLAPAIAPLAAWRRGWRTLRSLWRHWFLWLMLALLVLGLLATVVWLAGRHEVELVQERLERDTEQAAMDLRLNLARSMQSIQGLQISRGDAGRWNLEAETLLYQQRHWIRIEWRDAAMKTLAVVDTPFRRSLFSNARTTGVPYEVEQACQRAASTGSGSYSNSHYVPVDPPSTGIEVVEACAPMPDGSFVVATLSLRTLLNEVISADMVRGQEVSLNEPDGTRLAGIGAARRAGNRVFSAQQQLELPGLTLVLHVNGWRQAPDMFPNVLTALVTAMSIALVSVLVLLARDTRRRLRAESELSDALAFRQAMENSLITGLRARDMSGRITYVNPAFCAMVGYSAEQLLGTDDSHVPYWPPELHAEYRQRQRQRQSSGVTALAGFESIFQRADGTRLPVQIFETPLMNPQGVQTGWMSAYIDLSEQRRIEEISRASLERLQASARLATVGEMASLMSHELTQPLAAIASYATGSLNMLATDQSASAMRQDLTLAVRRIAEQADRAGRVIRSVHDFVRRRDRAREAVHPRALFEAIMPLARLQARKIGAQIVVQADDSLPRVQCDRTLVEQVLLNLVRNGLQAMDHPDLRERVLTLRAERVHQLGVDANGGARQWVEFSVYDLGCGISEEVQARLFTPFYTTRSDGMGLGLSLCRTVVEQHGGALVHQPHQPRGTQFRFTLPVATAMGDAHAPVS